MGISWEQAQKEFKLYLTVERAITENTLQAYMSDLKRYQDFANNLKEIASPEEVQLMDLHSYLQFLVEDCFLSERSMARNISTLRSFHSFLFSEELCSKDPSERLESPRFGRKLPVVLSIEEVEALFAAIDHSTPHGIRNRAMLEVLYSSGLRVSELIDLELSRMYLEDGYLNILGKGRKERLVPLGEPASNALSHYLKDVRLNYPIQTGHDDFVFLNKRGRKISRIMVFQIIKDLCLKVDIKKNVSPHTFRHTFATHLIEGGADLRAVQDMLGHESITTTEIYLHMDQQYLQEVHALYHPRK